MYLTARDSLARTGTGWMQRTRVGFVRPLGLESVTVRRHRSRQNGVLLT